jgi:hypothetical protein
VPLPFVVWSDIVGYGYGMRWDRDYCKVYNVGIGEESIQGSKKELRCYALSKEVCT